METPRRLAPTQDVTRSLYLASGNRCSYPGCDQPLMTARGILVGEIAHIEAALPDGPRFNAVSNNEQRRAYGNLVLVCATHHEVIDRDVETWTVEKLHALKRDHERIYTGVLDQLRRQVGDITEGTAWTPPRNPGQFIGGDLSDEEVAECVKDLQAFAERLARLPVGARSILAIIVNRGDETTGSWSHEISIPAALLHNVADCSRSELQAHYEVLEHAKLVSLSEDSDGRWTYSAYNSTPGIGWPVMVDLKRWAAGDPAVVRRVIVDLDFTALDA